MTWWMYILFYGVGWFTTAMIFTRTRPWMGCADECTYEYSRYTFSSRGEHTDKCGTYRLEPATPADAMMFSVIWPLWWTWAFFYGTLHWNYNRDPWTRSRRKAIRGLSDTELAELDKVLFDKELTDG